MTGMVGDSHQGRKRHGITSDLVLSQKRADNVMSFMNSQGVSVTRSRRVFG
jgi:outer membrane protein OmpA-like peptidoglycan-associated protein